MKKILSLLLLLPLMAISQTVPADATALENIQITNNTTSLTATKVNVQDANGVINTIPKADLVNVIEVNDVPSLPLIGEVGKIYVVKNLNKIYRWNGTFYQELGDVSYWTKTGDIIQNNNIGDVNVLLSSGKNFTVLGQGGQNVKFQSNGNLTSTNGIYANYIVANTAINGSLTTNNMNASFTPDQNDESFISSGRVKYSSDLSSIYDNRTLVDKGYVDNKIGGLQTALDLKANNSDVVKLTGDQTISGQKSFSLTGKIDMRTNNAFPAIRVTALGSNGESAAEFINSSTFPNSTALRLQTSLSGGVGNRALDVSNQSSIGTGIFSDASGGGVSISSQSGNGDSYISNITFGGTGRNYVGRNNGTETYSVDKIGNVIGNSYIKRSSPINNILLAGGGDLAQRTAFNKNFGTTAGTVVEGNDSRLSDSRTPTAGSSSYIQNQNASAQSANMWISGSGKFDSSVTTKSKIRSVYADLALESYIDTTTGHAYIDSVKDDAGYNMYFRMRTNGTPIYALSFMGTGAATFASTVTAASYTATSLPVFENNAAASSLAVGQFYRTSTGVLMVKF